MTREFKIVAGIFLFFFVYGLSSIYSSGEFITPIFLIQPIILLVAIIFCLMNRKVEDSWILLLYISVPIVSCAFDVFTMGLLSKITGNQWFVEFQESNTLSWIYIFVFFGFMIFISIYSFKKHKEFIIFGLNILLLGFTILLMLMPDSEIDPTITFFLFIILLFYTSNRIIQPENSVLSVLSSHLMLVCFLEGLEYLH